MLKLSVAGFLTARTPGRSMISSNRWEGQLFRHLEGDYLLGAAWLTGLRLAMIGIVVETVNSLSFFLPGQGFPNRYRANW